RNVLETGNAQRGCLVLCGAEMSLAAVAHVRQQTVEVILPEKPDIDETLLPVSILNYVRRSGEKVLLEDATVGSPLLGAEYIALHHPKSVLCLPIVRQARQVGLLYLENNLVTHAFTSGRMSVLEL